MEGTSENYIPQEAQPQEAPVAEPVPELSPEYAKLQELFAIAVEKGVDRAVAAAKELDPRIQEMFHDALADNPEWLKQLAESGKFENI